MKQFEHSAVGMDVTMQVGDNRDNVLVLDLIIANFSVSIELEKAENKVNDGGLLSR